MHEYARVSTVLVAARTSTVLVTYESKHARASTVLVTYESKHTLNKHQQRSHGLPPCT